MLKWTASAQKLAPDTLVTATVNAVSRTPRLSSDKRRKRRATIANKENIPVLTSTPMVTRSRNSPLVMAPLADILNVTPEQNGSHTPIRRRVSVNAFAPANPSLNRRHSSVGFAIPPIAAYAATLPKYEEEYSPSTILPTGQQLALRGLLPDAFMENPRYFTTTEVELEQKNAKPSNSLPKKRKLEQEFLAIAREEESFLAEPKNNFNNTGLVSNKMGDQTLDKLIDAILDSARKDEKKKKPRKSFNLRRRTLLKNQVEQQQNTMLSPSYTAGDDPCSDVSFLNCETFTKKSTSPLLTHQPATPEPVTPLMATTLSRTDILQMPTPIPACKQQDSFSLATPPSIRRNLKRRPLSKAGESSSTSAKKYKVDKSSYFEIGLALPSVYV